MMALLLVDLLVVVDVEYVELLRIIVVELMKMMELMLEFLSEFCSDFCSKLVAETLISGELSVVALLLVDLVVVVDVKLMELLVIVVVELMELVGLLVEFPSEFYSGS
jgi:hypothetical protein